MLTSSPMMSVPRIKEKIPEVTDNIITNMEKERFIVRRNKNGIDTVLITPIGYLNSPGECEGCQ